MLKTFLEHIAVVLCKKRLGKTAYIRKMRPFCDLPKMALKQRLQALKIVTLGQKLEIQNSMLKKFYNTLQLFYAKKKQLKKQLTFEKLAHFENC